MKLNVFYPPLGSEKCFEFDDLQLQPFYDKRISQEVSGDTLGETFKGYIFRISGGNDKQGFPMKQGVLVNKRVRLLLQDGQSCYRIRRTGERRRKSVRGCIVGPDLSVLNLVIVKQGDKPIPGLTNQECAIPRRRGPKRANTIRKLFNLKKEDDVRKYVVRREFTNKKGKKIDKAPKIQRLITPIRLQRKRAHALEKRNAQLKAKLEAAEYHKLLAQKTKELKEKRAASIAKRNASIAKKQETNKKPETNTAATKKVETKPVEVKKPVETKKSEVKKAEVKKPVETKKPVENKKPEAKKDTKKQAKK